MFHIDNFFFGHMLKSPLQMEYFLCIFGASYACYSSAIFSIENTSYGSSTNSGIL